MRVNGSEESRVRPHVVSITLGSHQGQHQTDKPDMDMLNQLSLSELKLLREKNRVSWTGSERQVESVITIDQLSITGMSLVFNPRAFWLRRIIWLTIIVCLLVWLCLQLRVCVERLSAGGTVRTWSRRTVDKIPLPAITVCHSNRFKKSVVLRHQAGNASWPRWHQMGYQTLNWTSFDGLDEFYAAASYSWDDMVLFCNVGALRCSEIGTFRTANTLLNGRCTTFNTNATVTKRLVSPQIVLALGEKELLGEFEHIGWKVFLHPQHVRYGDLVFFSGLLETVKVFGNRTHQVKVHRRITEELPQGSGKGCSRASDALEAYRHCLNVCLVRGMGRKVSSATDGAPPCPVPWIAKAAYRPNTPPCRTMEELERSSLGTHHGFKEQEFLASTAKCKCAPSCHADQYKIEEHEKWHVQETAIYLTYPKARNATVGAVGLWLSDMEEHIIEREAYSYDTFIADVGGSLGLMLGGSLLTFVEIVDCIIASCLSRRQKRA